MIHTVPPIVGAREHFLSFKLICSNFRHNITGMIQEIPGQKKITQEIKSKSVVSISLGRGVCLQTTHLLIAWRRGGGTCHVAAG